MSGFLIYQENTKNYALNLFERKYEISRLTTFHMVFSLKKKLFLRFSIKGDSINICNVYINVIFK